MRKMVIMSCNCRECVFHQKKCVLGHKRPWNSLSCDDYRPYCLVCSYPEVFCNTCRNLGSRRMKPLEVESRPVFDTLSHIDYECVWQPPVMQQ